MTITARLLVPVLLLTSAGCVHGGRHDGWVASRTRNVTVYTDRSFEHRHTQMWIEQTFGAYRAFFPDADIQNVEVLWARSLPGSATAVYGPLAPQTPEDVVLATVPGSGRIGRNGLIVMENNRRSNWRSGAHNLAHLFIERAVPRAPLWLHIGLARYMAGHRVHYSGKYWIACFGSRVFDRPLASGFRQREADGGPTQNSLNLTAPARVGSVMIPVADVIEGDWYDLDKNIAGWYNYTAYALVHYLIHGRNGAHQPRFRMLLRALAQGKSSEEALTLAYPHILPDEWDQELAAYVRPTRKSSAVTQVRTGPEGGGDPVSIKQGLCFRVPPLDYAQKAPTRTPVDEADIQEVMAAVRRLPLAKRRNAWYPEDIVRAEAAPGRGGTRPAAGQGAGTKEGAGNGKGTGTAADGMGGTNAPTGNPAKPASVPEGTALPDDDTPFLRESLPAPEDAPTSPTPETPSAPPN